MLRSTKDQIIRILFIKYKDTDHKRNRMFKGNMRPKYYLKSKKQHKE